MGDEFSGKVLLDMAISLDGYVAGPHDEDGGLYDWYFEPNRAPSDPNGEIIADLIRTTGAIIMGRRAYAQGEAQGGWADNPYQCEHFVLTHTPPEAPPTGTSFTFVTNGIESALRQAKAAAGDRHVVVAGGAQVAQQYLRTGLIEEIHLHLAPVLLGAGLRLFEVAGFAPAALAITRVIPAPGVTHLYYRVGKG